MPPRHSCHSFSTRLRSGWALAIDYCATRTFT